MDSTPLLPATIHTIDASDVSDRWAARKLRGVFHITDEAYHGGEGLSSTGVKKMLRSPAHFLEPTEDTDALRQGRMIHEMMFQPHRFDAMYAYEPRINGPKNKNPWKQEWDAFKEDCAAKRLQIIDADTSVMLRGMSCALRRNETWDRMAQSALYEVAAYAQRNVNGVAVLTKAKADMLIPMGDTLVIADLKSCQDARPEAFARSIIDYGYHISAAWYLDVFSAALDRKFESFVWIPVEKPSPHGVSFYPASKEMLRIGRVESDRAVTAYAECVKTGVWPAYTEAFQELELPTWYTRRFS